MSALSSDVKTAFGMRDHTETATRHLPWHMQFRLLFRLLFTDIRQEAPFLIVFSMLVPLGLLWALGTYVTERGTDAAWFLAGNAVVAVSFSSVLFTLSRVALMRLRQELDFYATLPVERTAFLAALFCLAQVAALPGLTTSLVFGHWLVGIPFAQVVVAFPLALLAASSLTVVGAWVGTLVDSAGRLYLYTTMGYLIVLFLTPVMIPPDRVPPILQWTLHLLPPGQAALALTEALAGRFEQRFWLLVGALTVWLVIAVVFAIRRLDWRRDA